MCGIIGYVGGEPVVPILVAGLRQLEYRGYDSAGLAVVNDAGETVVLNRNGEIVIEDEQGLTLLRRDDVEHLVMIGGPVDVVVETGIKWRPQPQPQPQPQHQHQHPLRL